MKVYVVTASKDGYIDVKAVFRNLEQARKFVEKHATPTPPIYYIQEFVMFG